MLKLNFTIDSEIAMMQKYHLSPNELFVTRLILHYQTDPEDTYMEEFSNLKVCNIREIFISLQEKGVILKSFKIPNAGETIDLYKIPINKVYTKGLYKAAYELGMDLFEHYPQFSVINGKTVALRSIAKKFNSIEDACRVYGKYIGWNEETHNKIIDLLNWSKDNCPLNMSLGTFIVNRSWLDLEAMKNGDIINVNFDSFTDI